MAEWPIAPVLKTGVPQGTGSSNLPLSASDSRSKRSVYPRNPEFSRGFFAFTARDSACHALHSVVQTDAVQCKFQRAVRHQYGHLGTTVGTSDGQQRLLPDLIARHEHTTGSGQIARFWRRPVYHVISMARPQLDQRIGSLVCWNTFRYSRGA